MHAPGVCKLLQRGTKNFFNLKKNRERDNDLKSAGKGNSQVESTSKKREFEQTRDMIYRVDIVLL